MSIALRSALYLSMNELAEAQTVAYGGGWSSSVDLLTQICRVQSIDLGLSLGAFDGRRPVGIALVGRRAERGWLHDIAVVPDHRRHGLGTRLMQAVLDEMRQAGVQEVELDVAATRRDAIGLYSRVGFEQTRSYLNLAATGAEIDLDRTELPPGRELVAGTDAQLIDAYARQQASEPAPCWDRSLASLLVYPDGYISRLVEGEREIGLMHYLARAASDHDPDRLRPLFVRMARDATTDDLRQLLAATGRAAFGQAKQLTIRVALEPEDSAFAAMLQEINMPVVAESHDMRLALSSPSS
jgi:ribosomal protein S18 acetylase RimI-like enzyme